MNACFRIAWPAYIGLATWYICMGLVADESSAKALVCIAVGAAFRWLGTELKEAR